MHLKLTNKYGKNTKYGTYCTEFILNYIFLHFQRLAVKTESTV